MRVNKNDGFSLVELSIALGLIAMLVGMISAGGGMAAQARLQREAQSVDNLRLAAQNYLSVMSLTYEGISIEAMKSSGYLPATFDPTGANSYGGDYRVNANTADRTRVDIALSSVPDNAAAGLSRLFRGKAETLSYDAGAKTWLATF
jgi:prepilin-type N-terminal cleavage/methylation domain-containing protein